MKLISLIVATALVLGAAQPAFSSGKIKVVTSTLDFADIVENIGGDRVDVYPIYRGLTDLHFFEPVPSQVMKLKRTDMLVVVGLDADVWIRSLIDASRNPRIKFGASGYIDPSEGIRPIQVPTGRIDGSMGDVHPYGNPHYWLTPENLEQAVNNIYEGLVRQSPDDEEYFSKNRNIYLEKVHSTFARIAEMMKPYRGAGVVEYHQSWDYFCEFLGLDVVATIEPKPGIPPSAKHLRDVVQSVKAGGAKILLAEPYYPDKPIKYVQRETGIEVLRLPIYLMNKDRTGGVLGLLLKNAGAIAGALSRTSPASGRR